MGSELSLVADSLGWALLHSVWQIALIAGLVFVAMRLVPRELAQLRCAIAYFGMVGALVAFVVTFFVYFRAPPPAGAIAFAPPAPPAEPSTLIETLGEMTWLVSLCWGIGFVMLCARYVGALRATHRLRTAETSAVPPMWEARFRTWAERLGADATTVLRCSARISAPVTIGVFRPMVLVPAGFFLRMPAEQAEAILLHELAHICRQDYLLGLVQAMISNIFFFHPGIYYLSRIVDDEREFACDARVVRETGDAAALAQGLGRIAIEDRAARHGFAMAADGGRSPLMSRIGRLRDRPARADHGTSVPAAAIAMVFVASLMIAVGADATANPAPADEENETLAVEAVAAPAAPAWPEPVAAPDVPAAPEAAPAPHAKAHRDAHAVAPAEPAAKAATAPAPAMPVARFEFTARDASPSGFVFAVASAVPQIGFAPSVQPVAYRTSTVRREEDCEDDDHDHERLAAIGREAERRAAAIEREAERRAAQFAAAHERRMARLEAEQARREAILAAEQERRDAMLDAAEARRQAILEAEQERRDAELERQAALRVARFEAQQEEFDRRMERLSDEMERRFEHFDGADPQEIMEAVRGLTISVAGPAIGAARAEALRIAFAVRAEG